LADNGKIRVYSRYISIAPFSANQPQLTPDVWSIASARANANHMFGLKDAIETPLYRTFFAPNIRPYSGKNNEWINKE
jgi:hypothetical protein